MNLKEAGAYGIFVSYFLLIFACFALVFRSLSRGRKLGDVFSGRAFLFIRTAFVALVATWTYMFKFMAWSYDKYARTHYKPTVGLWLVHTGLFEQAWSIVCATPSNWWWSSFICTWTVIFTAIIWTESGRRGIKYSWAYMLLGQLVAMSVSTSLFLAAMYLHPRRPTHPSQGAPPRLYIPLVLTMVTIHLVPQFTGTDRFLNNLLWMHALLLVALLAPHSKPDGKETMAIPFPALYTLLLVGSAAIHVPNTFRMLEAAPSGHNLPTHLIHKAFAHPAQTSISLDVTCVALTVTLWYIVSGSAWSVALKTIAALGLLSLAAVKYAGATWGFIASIVPIVLLGAGAFAALGVQRMRKQNTDKRAALLGKLGLVENAVVQGTDKNAPYLAGKATVVGLWHPYCNAGGGGERVLWSAIAYLQRAEPETVVLVYSGDYPTASKDEMLAKVFERFSIRLSGDRLAFIPLPSRHMISDTYWKHFTLLGQSFGSLVLAWEGLCSKDGLWGDVFLDTMGYGFTYPFVRLLAGSEIGIGAYTHYPTVSTDMVKRVRERAYGVENAGASKSWWRTQVKLVYYRIFTSLYAASLLFAEVIMTNSSWTQAHIQSLLLSARSGWLASILLKDESAMQAREKRGEPSGRGVCEVVYPPCDVTGLVKLGRLQKRKREIVSLAQFRPEKEHSKQLYALQLLLEREDMKDVRLTLMGGSRGPADQGRLDGLRSLAQELGIANNVEFVVNAPYPEIVRRLGEASIGLNSMQDEHFGINVVEFMAAGLIPVVHASAGPMMDIVVPYKGQRTGFHATDAASFAVALGEALSLSPSQQLRMREAARSAAQDKFSQEKFESSFGQSWARLRGLAASRYIEDE